MERKLEIGPEKHRLGDDWITLDCVAKEGLVDYVARWGSEALPFPNDHFDLVYASHVIEHVPWYETLTAFREVFRILRPGGTFEVHTVDFDVLVGVYFGQPPPEDWDAGGRNRPFHLMRWIASRIFSYGRPQDENWHKAIFTRDYLAECLRDCGFADVATSVLDRPRGFHSHSAINLSATCKRPR